MTTPTATTTASSTPPPPTTTTTTVSTRNILTATNIANMTFTKLEGNNFCNGKNAIRNIHGLSGTVKNDLECANMCAASLECVAFTVWPDMHCDFHNTYCDTLTKSGSQRSVYVLREQPRTTTTTATTSTTTTIATTSTSSTATTSSTTTTT